MCFRRRWQNNLLILILIGVAIHSITVSLFASIDEARNLLECIFLCKVPLAPPSFRNLSRYREALEALGDWRSCTSITFWQRAQPIRRESARKSWRDRLGPRASGIGQRTPSRSRPNPRP